MVENESGFSSPEQPFRYLWSLVDEGSPKRIETIKYLSLIFRQRDAVDRTPEGVTVVISDLLNRDRLVESYKLDLRGVNQIQCQIPPIINIPMEGESVVGEIRLELGYRFALERAVMVAEFIKKELDNSQSSVLTI